LPESAADGKPLPDGLWDIFLAVGAQGVSREVRIGSKRRGEVSGLVMSAAASKPALPIPRC
jgi:hypothetical protein